MKMIKYLLLPILSLSMFTSAFAEESTLNEISSQLDTIEDNQEIIISKTVDSPLKNKKHGLELNFARVLLISDDFISFSGSYSRFDHENNAEWTFPVYYSREDNYSNKTTNVATLDVHYRKFLSGSVRGFYLSGFSRLTHIKGPTAYVYNFNANNQNTQGSETKLGLGVGIGYRIFSGENFYWGASLSVGRNFIGENDKFEGAFIDDSEFILDVELLKFGYAF